jgi:hypothetical protein
MASTERQMLSRAAFGRAAVFLHAARPVERTLFAFRHEDGPVADVVAALAAHQNSDGGFARLEPDFAAPVSSALSTAMALHIMCEVGADAEQPIVRRALEYLVAIFDPALDAWPIVPAHDNTHPHAPWWNHGADFVQRWAGFVDNPRPDVLACLLAFPLEATAELRSHVMAAVHARVEAATEVEMHGLLAYLRLFRAPNLPEPTRALLAKKLPGWIATSVQRNPAEWGGYGLRPLQVIDGPSSPFLAGLEEAVAAELDYLIATQGVDGAWSPTWSWFGAFPDAWEIARREWQGCLTLEALRVLRAFGRIESAIN